MVCGVKHSIQFFSCKRAILSPLIPTPRDVSAKISLKTAVDTVGWPSSLVFCGIAAKKQCSSKR